jgi:hypothetical protein
LSDMGLVARGVACAPRPRNPFGIALLAHPRPSMSMALPPKPTHEPIKL